MKRGDRFEHAHWLAEDLKSPLVCVVTRTTRHAIYWRPEGGGNSMFFHRAVLEQQVARTDAGEGYRAASRMELEALHEPRVMNLTGDR